MKIRIIIFIIVLGAFSHIICYTQETKCMNRNWDKSISASDTIFFQYFDVNTDGLIDTLVRTFTQRNDTIYISYSLKEQQNVIKIDQFTDTYLSSLSDCSEKMEWLNFVKYNSNFETYNFSDFNHLFNNAIKLGVNNLKEYGLIVHEEQYKNYLLNYKGALFTYGHPEMQEGLYIWYQPLKRFILFYHP